MTDNEMMILEDLIDELEYRAYNKMLVTEARKKAEERVEVLKKLLDKINQ